MKNVAGFDVARLMTGALGTLGLITEVSLKCLPMPKAESTRCFECSADQAIRMTNEWAGQPLPLSATAFHDGRLYVRLSGAEPAVAAAIARIGGEAVGAADDFWREVRDHRHAFFATARARGTPLWRVSVQSTAPHADLGGSQLIEWGGALRWLAAGERTDSSKVRAWAGGHGGHATLFRAERKDGPVFAPLPEALLTLHRKLKVAFDPRGILNRGRLLPDF
jgi:glycolate oxidase FAD binding subunit